jgi:hypothetical protein
MYLLLIICFIGDIVVIINAAIVPMAILRKEKHTPYDIKHGEYYQKVW